jgi:hypothetical protein
MRGHTLRGSGRASTTCGPRAWQGLFSPVHPDQEWALPLAGPPASDGKPSDTPGELTTRQQGNRSPATRVQGALLPEPPARKGPRPFPPYPRMRRIA